MKKNSSRSTKNKSGNHLWLITGLLILVVVAGLFYLKGQNTISNKEQPSKIVSNKTPIKPKEASKQNTPQFDFYTVSPNQKTPVKTSQQTPVTTKATSSKSIPAPVTTNKTTKKPVTTKPINYTLQAASTKSFAEADSLKAQLILLGYNVKIKKIKVGSATWNRVDVGPYTSLSAAQAAQASLKKQQINSILVK